MATEIADAYIALHTKMEGVENEVAKGLGKADSEFEKAGKRQGGLFGSIVGGSMLGALGAQAIMGAISGITGYLGESIQSYKEAELAQVQLSDAYARFPAVTSVSIDSLRALNTEIMNKTRFDDDALASGQATLAQYGLTGEQLAELTPLLADYAAKTGVDATTAADQLGKAMLGQGRALKGVGIDFEDTGSVAGNFQQVMEGLTTQVGGFAETEGLSAAGTAERMKNAFGELQETIGGALLPRIVEFQQFFLNNLMPILAEGADFIASVLGPGIDSLGGFFAGIDFSFLDGIDLSALAGMLSYISPLGIAFHVLEPIIPLLAESFMSLAGAIGGALMEVLPIVSGLMQTLVGVLSGAMAEVIPLITGVLEAVLPLVATLIDSLVPVITQLGTVFAEIAGAVLPVVATLLGVVTDVFGSLLEALLPVVGSLVEALAPILALIGPLLTAVLDAVLPLVMTLVDFLAPILVTIAEIIGAVLVPVFGFLAGVIQTVAGIVTWFVTEVVVPFFQNTLIPIISNVGNTFRDVFGGLGDFFSGIWSGIEAGFKGFINFIIDGINGFIGGLNEVGNFISDATGGSVDFKIGKLPRLAEGGIVPATAGGQLAVIGEGRYDEAVIPLTPEFKAGFGGGNTVKIYPTFQQQDARLQMRQWGREARSAFAAS